MSKNKNISLIKNMAKTFEPTEKELKEFQSRVKYIIAKQKKIKITIVTKPKPKK